MTANMMDVRLTANKPIIRSDQLVSRKMSMSNTATQKSPNGVASSKPSMVADFGFSFLARMLPS